MLEICFKGTFEKLEVAVRVGVVTRLCSVFVFLNTFALYAFVCTDVLLCLFALFFNGTVPTWQNIVDEGYAATQTLTQLHEAIIENGDLNDRQKSAIAEKMAVRQRCWWSSTASRRHETYL